MHISELDMTQVLFHMMSQEQVSLLDFQLNSSSFFSCFMDKLGYSVGEKFQYIELSRGESHVPHACVSREYPIPLTMILG